MAVTELRYENGRLSGLFIPIEDLEELKGNLKSDSQLLTYLDDILFKQQDENDVENLLALFDADKIQKSFIAEDLVRELFNKDKIITHPSLQSSKQRHEMQLQNWKTNLAYKTTFNRTSPKWTGNRRIIND